MFSKRSWGIAAVAMVAACGVASGVSAQTTEPCSKVALWASPTAGYNSALPVSTRFDVMYDLVGGSGVDLQPRNGGVFDAFFCNATARPGAYFVRYQNGGQDTSTAPAQSCYQLRGLVNLVIQGNSSWKACVFVRYRD